MLPTSPYSDSSSGNLPNWLFLLMGIGGTASLIGALVLGIYLGRRWEKQRKVSDTEMGPVTGNPPPYDAAVDFPTQPVPEDDDLPAGNVLKISVQKRFSERKNTENYSSKLKKPAEEWGQKITLEGSEEVVLSNILLGQGREEGTQIVKGKLISQDKIVAVKKTFNRKTYEDTKKVGGSLDFTKANRHVLSHYGYLETVEADNEGRNSVPTFYIVTRYLSGGDGKKLLEKWENRKPPLSKEERFDLLLPIATDLLQALQTLHSEHFYHLDIKPENFVLDTEKEIQEAVLIDFDVSKKTDSNGLIGPPSLGDSRYYSPERADFYCHYYHHCYGGEVKIVETDENGRETLKTLGKLNNPSFNQKDYFPGAVADLWGLGVTLLELILGKNPFSQGLEIEDKKIPGLTHFFSMINDGTPDFFNHMLKMLEEKYAWFKNPIHPLVEVIKGLLVVDYNHRMTLQQALNRLNPHYPEHKPFLFFDKDEVHPEERLDSLAKEMRRSTEKGKTKTPWNSRPRSESTAALLNSFGTFKKEEEEEESLKKSKEHQNGLKKAHKR